MLLIKNKNKKNPSQLHQAFPTKLGLRARALLLENNLLESISVLS